MITFASRACLWFDSALATATGFLIDNIVVIIHASRWVVAILTCCQHRIPAFAGMLKVATKPREMSAVNRWRDAQRDSREARSCRLVRACNGRFAITFGALPAGAEVLRAC